MCRRPDLVVSGHPGDCPDLPPLLAVPASLYRSARSASLCTPPQGFDVVAREPAACFLGFAYLVHEVFGGWFRGERGFVWGSWGYERVGLRDDDSAEEEGAFR